MKKSCKTCGVPVDERPGVCFVLDCPKDTTDYPPLPQIIYSGWRPKANEVRENRCEDCFYFHLKTSPGMGCLDCGSEDGWTDEPLPKKMWVEVVWRILPLLGEETFALFAGHRKVARATRVENDSCWIVNGNRHKCYATLEAAQKAAEEMLGVYEK
jgi:hypothetical protein